MNLQEALTKPDKTKLPSITLKTFKNYGAKQVGSNGSYLSSVMLDTPQGSPKTYLKVWSKTAQIPVQDSTEYTIQAKITPQGAQGITINEYNGKKSIDIDIDTVNLLPAGASPAAEVMAHAQEPVKDAEQVGEMMRLTSAVTTLKNTEHMTKESVEVNLSRDELITEFAKIYSESMQKIHPAMSALPLSDEEASKRTHEFAMESIKNVALFWFGKKMTY